MKIPRSHRGNELFTTLAYDPDTSLFLHADQSVSFGFVCQPLTSADPSLLDRINSFLNQDWPADTLLQISLWTSPDIEETLAIMKARRLHQTQPTYQSMTAADIAFLRRGTEIPLESVSGTRLRRSEVIVAVKLPIAAPKPNPQELARATELQMATKQSLTTIGLHPEVLTNDRYVRLLSTILNWGEHAGWKDRIMPECDVQRLIRDQLFDYDTDLRTDERGIWLGEKRVKMLSVKRYPEQMYFGSAQRYLGDPLSGTRGIRQNILITITLHYPDAENTKAHLERVRQFITNQASTPIVRFLPVLQQRKQNFDLLFEAFGNNDRPIRAYFGIALFCDEAEEAQAVSNARVYFRELGFQLLEDKYFALPLFLFQSTPGY